MPAPNDEALHALRCALAAESVKLRLATLAQTWKANFDPSQPRVPRGNPDGGQWTDGGGGSGPRAGGTQYAQNTPRPPRGGARPVLVNGRWVQPTTAQSMRLAAAQLRADAAIARVRTLDPNWRPQPSAYESVEGLIQRTDAIAREAQARLDQLRSGIGGNFGPALTPPVANTSAQGQRFDGPAWIEAYRTAHSRSDLFGNPIGLSEKDTISVTELDGRLLFGVNSDASTYTGGDRSTAQRYVDVLVNKYPAAMSSNNVGQIPNNSLYHAESTILLRTASVNGGSLAGLKLEVHVSRVICTSCDTVLPKLGLELGNPVVTFLEPSGARRTMQNGDWVE